MKHVATLLLTPAPPRVVLLDVAYTSPPALLLLSGFPSATSVFFTNLSADPAQRSLTMTPSLALHDHSHCVRCCAAANSQPRVLFEATALSLVTAEVVVHVAAAVVAGDGSGQRRGKHRLVGRTVRARLWRHTDL